MAKGNIIKALLSIAGNVDPSLDKAINTAQKKFGGVVASDEIGLPVKSNGLVLPCGASGRWQREE